MLELIGKEQHFNFVYVTVDNCPGKVRVLVQVAIF
jgi:hypothetical protein